MTEGHSKRELSEQFATDLVYFNFVRLAQTYGSNPAKDQDKINPQMLPLLNGGERTLRVLVPSVNPDQKHKDFISGVDHGDKTIKIFYRKGHFAAHVRLELNPKTNSAKMITENSYKATRVGDEEDSHTFDPVDKSKNKPDIYEILELLDRARHILLEEQRQEFEERHNKPKLSVRQKLVKKLEGK